MFTSFERMMAFRYLRARKAEGFVSVIAGFSFLGIMLGVATLIIVMSVMNGFRAELIGRILGINGHVNLYSIDGRISDYKDLQKRLVLEKDVERAIPMIEKQSLLNIKQSSTGVLIRGIELNEFINKPILSESLKEGEIAAFQGFSLIIGKEIAKRFGVNVGDTVTLLAPQGKSSPFGTMPRSRGFTVVGIFDVEMYEYNNGFAFMPLEAAQKFYNLPDSINLMEVFVKDAQGSMHIAKSIAKDLPPHFRVNDWTQSNASFFNALQVERNVMFLILTLIIIVAAFNIISSMIMLVKDKGKDIAIIRTMGAQRKSVLKVFILTGSFIGFVGTAVGATLGITFAMNIEGIRQWLESLTGTELFAAEIYFLSQLPAQIDWQEVTVVIVMAFAISLLATLYPAWRAARLDPVEALRYE
jgi:lipoprotein-releasing system permease protein